MKLICLFIEKELLEWKKFKADNYTVSFLSWFCIGTISDGFHATKSKEVSSNWNVYNFSVDYNAIDKSGILNIHKY